MKSVARFGRVTASALVVALATPSAGADRPAPVPRHLRDTGLFVAGSTTAVRAENLPFSPQYPLWSDGTTKRRWLYLPPGTTIDASQPDAWVFPPGSRLWKEFSHARSVETRFIERLADGSWRYATYIWNAEGTDAVLAPTAGIAGLPLHGAPGGRYTIPAEADCRACHEGGPVPVLGASAIQLSPDRDPLAPHSEPIRPEHVDLRVLVARNLVRNLAPALLERAPRIVAATPTARAALGYLHGNCGHCHNGIGPLAPLELVLAQEAADGAASAEKAMRSILGHSSRLALRMQSRNPLNQMPPLGTRIADAEAMALIEPWIHHHLPNRKERLQ